MMYLLTQTTKLYFGSTVRGIYYVKYYGPRSLREKMRVGQQNLKGKWDKDKG